jgi:hypothetical protein
MPTIQRFRLASIKIYADDHNPPHFHIVGISFQVMVRIADLSITAGKATKTQIAEAMVWAKANSDILAAKWAELNERN